MLEFEKHILTPTPLIALNHPLFREKSIEVYVKRDDLTHEEISGNKFRKLKYNLLAAISTGFECLTSFGGAHSNHIAALAAAGRLFGFNTKGIIRGEELTRFSSPTLAKAVDYGMDLRFVSRSEFREMKCKYSVDNEYIIPEGGSNALALQGVAELVNEILTELMPSHILCACGTGGTMAGILSNVTYTGEVIGIPVLKQGEFIREEVVKLNSEWSSRGQLFTNYHFGGYGKYTFELLEFLQKQERLFEVPLEQVYTAKAFYALFDLIEKNYFKPYSKVVFVHTGGLQGRLEK